MEEKSYASKGLAGTALGLSIGALGAWALGLGNGSGNGNGFLGFGNGANNEVAELKAMRYTDQVGIDLYKNIIEQSNVADAKISGNLREVMSYIVELGKEVALNKQAVEYENKILSNKIDCCCEKMNMNSAFNKQLGELADASILSYVNSTFIPGTLKLNGSNICPGTLPTV